MRTVLNWETLQQVFYEAVEVEVAERPAFLDRRCAGDLPLRRQVESLLVALDEADRVIAPIDTAEIEAALEAPAPGSIGPYRVLSLLGRGGMGAVYLAERDDAEFRRKVAVKLTRSALLDAAARARFRAERQILANLSHPNIASLLDGGTTPEGAPYLVMEYVEGVPIHEFCGRPGVTERRKLELFRQICSAVQAAHQNLVIHRDIKPGNILVKADGTPVLLDFGIAKLLDPAASGVTAAFTRSFERLMTPEYASPEQIRGEAITTATDIYSLGVLLYELLSGAPPFRLQGMSLAEMERTVNNGAAPLLPGDAGRIAAKAMHQDPIRRYASADQLADDVTRLLEGRPIAARPDTAGYRFRKWVSRNRALAASLGLLAVMMVVLVVALAVGLSITREAQQRAERRFGEVRELASKFIFDFHDAIRDLPGSTAARKMVVERAIQSLQGLEAEAGDDVPFRIDLARGWAQVAQIQHRSGEAHLGDAKGARQSLQRAIALLEPIHRQDPTNRQATLLRLEVESSLSRLEEAERSQSPAALLAERRRLVGLIEPLYRKDPSDATVAKAWSSAAVSLARAHEYSGEIAVAHEQLIEVERAYRDLLARQPDDAELMYALSIVLSTQGNLLGSAFSAMNLGRDDDALLKYEEELRLTQRLQATHPHNQSYRRIYLSALNNLAALYEVLGRLDDSIATATVLVKETAADFQRDPLNAETMRNYGVMLNNLGDVQTTAKLYPAAERSLGEALRIREGFAAKFPNTSQGTVDVASTLLYLGELQNETGRPREAAASLRRSIALREKVLAASSNASELLWKQLEALDALGIALAKLGSADCRDVHRKAEAIAVDLAKAGKLATSKQGAAERIRKQMEGCPAG
jgi:tetratricopeptide (TPR) repeat protein/tRNA A-37 threonylcarbamoyl transferase component Bud32